MAVTPERPTAAGAFPWRAVVGITLLGGCLRGVALGDVPMWLDENATFLSLRHLWDRGPEAPIFVQASNPLYYGLLWGWAQLFGDSAAALRSLSVLAGTACIPLGAAIAARLGGVHAARFAALGIALHPLQLHYSREARAYALWCLLLLAAIGALVRAARRNDLASWSLAVAAWLGAFGVHVFALFALPATVASILWASDRARALRNWLGFAVGVTVPALLYVALVLAPVLSEGTGAWLDESSAPPFGVLFASLWALLPAGAYPGHLSGLSLSSAGVVAWTPAAVALLAAALPLGLIPWLWAESRRVALPLARASSRLALPALTLGPLLVLWGVSLARPAYLVGRYDLIAWPAVTLWTSVGLAGLASRAGYGRWTARAVAGLLAACSLVPIGRELAYQGGDRFDHRRAQRLAELAGPADLAIVFSNDGDSLAHGLHRAGFRGRLRPFPSWLGRQIAFLDSRGDLSAERAPMLARDAARLLAEIRQTHARGGQVLWLGDALRLDGRGARAVLPERLGQQLRAAGYARVELDPALAIERLDPTAPAAATAPNRTAAPTAPPTPTAPEAPPKN